MKTPLRIILGAAWIGLLVVPFGGLKTAGYVALAVLVGSVIFNALGVMKERGALSGVISAAKLFDELVHSFTAGRRKTVAVSVIMAFLLALPIFANRYTLDLSTQTGIYIILALGLNIVVGQTGLLVFGYVAFYAVGAYTYAILSTAHGVGFWTVLPIAAIFAGICGLVLGAPALRLRGDYLAIVTLGFGEITRIVLNNWDSVTGGPNGITGVKRPDLGAIGIFGGFQDLTHFYYLVLGLMVLTVVFVRRLNDSRIGRAWIAIREDEVAAEAMGINTFGLKLLAFSLGAMVAGLAGVFYVAKMGFVSPESFNFFESVIILCMIVLGGMGSIPGVILGAVALYVLPEALREFQQYRMVVFGAALVVIMIFKPEGFIGTRRRGIETAHGENEERKPVAV